MKARITKGADTREVQIERWFHVGDQSHVALHLVQGFHGTPWPNKAIIDKVEVFTDEGELLVQYGMSRFQGYQFATQQTPDGQLVYQNNSYGFELLEV